jgi:hypothetical protein
MSKDKISDYSETPGNNTDIGGINIAEGMLPSDVNNAIREQMAQLKKFQSGTSSESVTFVTANLTTANVGQVNVDNLRLDGNTFSSTNSNGNIAITPNGTGEVDISKVDIDGGAIDGTIIGGASAAAITGTTITANTSVSTDTISEKTSAAGVTVDGVLLKDSQVNTDQINEKTSATGVTIDGVLLKDSTVNKVTITAPATAATLTIADNKTLTASNSITLAGTDGTTMTFPSTSQTVAGLGLAQTFTVSQRGTVTADNDGSFDLDVTNNFSCTPTGNFTLTFTNRSAGQSGFILLDNSGAHTISAHADTLVTATALATISAAGVYLLSYFATSSKVYVVNSSALA